MHLQNGCHFLLLPKRTATKEAARFPLVLSLPYCYCAQSHNVLEKKRGGYAAGLARLIAAVTVSADETLKASVLLVDSHFGRRQDF